MTSTPPPSGEIPENKPYRPSGPQWLAVGFLLAFGTGFLIYHALKDNGLHQSAALYVGIPVVLAVILVLTAPSERATGTAMKVTTILLLLSIPVLGEGACCVLMAAPIFYLFVYLAAAGFDNVRRRGGDDRPTAFALVVPALLLLMALEGTMPMLTSRADEASTATRIVDLPSSEVAAALARPLKLDVRRTGILAIGFPTPLRDSGGLTVGATRTIEFDGAHHRSGPTAQHHWGTAASALVLRVENVTPDSVTFVPVGDTTPIASWLRWERIDVSWRAVDRDRSEIRWQLHYTRLLSPAWYFGPIERIVTTRTADYLIRAVDIDGAGMPHQHGHTD
ncbi:hypothetical protein GOARA_063_00130 [Gordonia araii NBRC 100433]|uniref:Uncharacterized protein n=1 Tax=Gordonia araii NBRC 100433 TaxID=1073574 RepID=G7H4N9_9ACTN|nr:hypothetical protein [Gordonia araii]NNG98044.1 hypothetical protein [Gordonia araii NBRC 100433]GAB10814.1 hypothetical protein GOARA_063_00130 [Gordonia araii NBRC 100433]